MLNAEVNFRTIFIAFDLKGLYDSLGTFALPLSEHSCPIITDVIFAILTM